MSIWDINSYSNLYFSLYVCFSVPIWWFCASFKLSSACTVLFVVSNSKIRSFSLWPIINAWSDGMLSTKSDLIASYFLTTAYTPLSARSINWVVWRFKVLSDCKKFPPLWYHTWHSYKQPVACQILVGTVSVSCFIYFLSAHIFKQWLSLPSSHFG